MSTTDTDQTARIWRIVIQAVGLAEMRNRGQTTGTGMPCAPERQKPGNKMLGFAPINRGVGVL